MKAFKTKKLLMILFLFFGLHNLFYAQNFNLTEVDKSGHATIKAIIPNATSVRLKGLGGTWDLTIQIFL
jgi:hypothetical protein